MKKEFIVERHGKSFVLYSGLLDEAHSQGLKSITTSLLQTPNDANGSTAICLATVEMEGGRTFSGIGDATPHNVNEMMRNCLIRMAETRAKARALRDAVNVGTVALEELEEATEYAPAGKPARTSAPKAAETKAPVAGRGRGATEPQLRAIYSIAQVTLGMGQSQVEEESRGIYGLPPGELTKEQASDFIDRLKSEVRKRPAA
ncbi:MAG TPA: hypothetical protein VJ256_06010 [Dehalococcoidia bacterium]|nr:hypothetical protein [Dehalococcoidia bacterium]